MTASKAFYRGTFWGIEHKMKETWNLGQSGWVLFYRRIIFAKECETLRSEWVKTFQKFLKERLVRRLRTIEIDSIGYSCL